MLRAATGRSLKLLPVNSGHRFLAQLGMINNVLNPPMFFHILAFHPQKKN